jgi:hypothetical protein
MARRSERFSPDLASVYAPGGGRSMIVVAGEHMEAVA